MHYIRENTLNFKSSSPNSETWKPLLFDLSLVEDEKNLYALIDDRRVWKVYDTLNDQLEDLIRSRYPHLEKKIDAKLMEAQKKELLQGQSMSAFGRWVFFDWSGKLVHCLPENLFQELRLNRNKHKLTDEEQSSLLTKTVGIIGLSVGNIIAYTLALEGLCGSFKLADFDHLELSNMNRIHASVSDIMIPKTTLAARQIFELNPYASITLFPQGLNEGNIDTFMRGDRKLDVLIEECDGLRMKCLARERARSLGIPVLMETSDRGMLDVERFDLEPGRPIFHGMLGDLKSEDIPEKLSNDEKVRYAAPILGIDTLSTRFASSMVEINNTISTWPQLGSDVTLGAATIGTAIKQLFVQNNLSSGRRFVDLDKLITADTACVRQDDNDANRYEDFGALKSGLDPRIPSYIVDIVNMGIQAPSGGNVQPWQFQYDGDALWVLKSNRRTNGYTFSSRLDGLNNGVYLSIGACIFNIKIAARKIGLHCEVTYFPLGEEHENVVARIKCSTSTQNDPRLLHLVDCIPERVTNRRTKDVYQASQEDIEHLQYLASSEEAILEVCSDNRELEVLGKIVGGADVVRFLNQQLHTELMSELRWNTVEARTTYDGIELSSLELTEKDRVGIKVISRPDVSAFLRETQMGKALGEIAEKTISSTSSLCMLHTKGTRPQDIVLGGETMQYLWLESTKRSMYWHPMTTLPYMQELAQTPAGDMFSRNEKHRLSELNSMLNVFFSQKRGYKRLMLFRLFKGAKPTSRSLRLDVSEVLSFRAPI